MGVLLIFKSSLWSSSGEFSVRCRHSDKSDEFFFLGNFFFFVFFTTNVILSFNLKLMFL